MIQIIVPLDKGKVPVTLNTQGNMHRKQLARIKKETEIAVSNVCASAGVPYMEVIDEVLFTLVVGDRIMRDADNLAPFAKATLDGMRKTGVIPEDHYRIVKRVSYNIHYDKSVKQNYMMITLWPDEKEGHPDILVSDSTSTRPGRGHILPEPTIPSDVSAPKEKTQAGKKTPAKKRTTTPPARARSTSGSMARTPTAGRVITITDD